MQWFNPFENTSSGGGGGGTSEKVRYSIQKVTDGTSGEVTYKLMQSINNGQATQAGSVIGLRGNQILVSYDNQLVLLDTAIDNIETLLEKTYNFTTFTELHIDTYNKTLVEITEELIAKNLPQNTIVTGQIYTAALPFSGNGEAEVIVNSPAFWWKCGSLTNAPYSWTAITGSSNYGDNGLVMDWTPVSYTLPTASGQTLGGVKVGSGLSIDNDGVLSANVQSIPVATSQVVGGIKVGSGLSIANDGTLSANSYTLPTASDQTLGGVKIGSGLSIDGSGVLSATGGSGGETEYYAGRGIDFTPGSEYIDISDTENWEQGSIGSSGDISSDTRLRTKEYIPIEDYAYNDEIALYAKDTNNVNLTWALAVYDENKNIITDGNWLGYGESQPINSPTWKYCRFCVNNGGYYIDVEDMASALVYKPTTGGYYINADIATQNSLGIVKPGTNLSVDSEGALSFTPVTDNVPTYGSTNLMTSGSIYNALTSKQNTLVFDIAPKAGSSNPVASSGLYTEFQTVATRDTKQQELIDWTAQKTVKNLLSFENKTSTVNGVTFTVHDDTTVDISGAVVSGQTFGFVRLIGGTQNTNYENQVPLPRGDYKLVCSGGSAATYYFELGYRTSSGSARTTRILYDGTAEFTISSNTARYDLTLYSVSRTTNYEATVAPMLCLYNFDNTVVPYAPTNRELYEMVNQKQATLTFDSTPTDGSSNPVTSDGIYDALVDKITVAQAIESMLGTSSATNLVQNENLNGKRDLGIYIGSDSVSSSIVNNPVSSAGTPFKVYVIAIESSTMIMQILIPNTNVGVYTRVYDGTNQVWGVWQQYARINDIAPIATKQILGQGTRIRGTDATHANMNNYYTYGNYYIDSSDDLGYIDSKPNPVYNSGARVIVLQFTGSSANNYNCVQIWIPQILGTDAGRYYMRYRTTSTSNGTTIINWTTWKTYTDDAGMLDSVFGIGTAITATSSARVDLDTITTIGRYQCGQSVCQYVDNRPDIGIYRGFSLFVFTNTAFTSTQRYVQQLRYNDVNFAGCFFERFKVSNDAWSDWYKYTGDIYPYAKTNSELQRSVMPTNLLRTQRAAMSVSGMSLTPKKNGTYVLNGTSSANSSFIRTGFFGDIPSSLIGETLKLTGGISANVSLRVYTSKSTSTPVYEDTGSGVTFTLTSEMLSNPYDIRVYVANGTECSNVVLKPMLCVADESSNFVPYIPTNDELRKSLSRFDVSKIVGTSYIAIGDSIVEYQGVSGNPHTTKGFSYGYIEAIEDDYGVTCTNLGQAGHTIADDIADLLLVDYSAVSIVTIGYGVNDARLNLDLGDITDTYDANAPTFCGCLNGLITKICGDNPFCNVIVLSPIQRDIVNGFGSFTPNTNGKTLEDFANACIAVAGYNAVPCVDMFHNSRINSQTFGTVLKDGVHPNNFGYKLMYSAMRPALLSLVIPKD